MILNKKLSLGIFAILLLLAACSQAESVPTPTEAVAAVAPEATETAETVEEPTALPLPDSPTNTPEPASEEEAAEPEPAEPTPTEAAESEPAAEAQVNGRYETTYFRGLETAPVTMIDYSDFL